MPIKTKGEHINRAFSHLKINGIVKNQSPDDNRLALETLEDMAAEIEARNICINFAYEGDPDPATVSGIPMKYNQMISTNLAMRLAADFGKDVVGSLLSNQASAAMSSAYSSSARVNQVSYPARQPLGSGNARNYNQLNRFYRTKRSAPISCDTESIQLNVVQDYIATWASWLDDGETILSYAIKATSGLQILSSQIQNSATEIYYELKSIDSGAETVTISIVTSISTPNNADVRTIEFNVINNESL